MRYPEHLLKLIALFKKFPGIGTKSAERFAFHLLQWPEGKLEEMGFAIQEAKKKLKNCLNCGCLIGETSCHFCDPQKRDTSILCLVSSLKDVFLIEETGEFKGLYHVLGALLSPIHGTLPSLEKIQERIQKHAVCELIIALDSTLEGDATSLYLKRELASPTLTISRLALGLPLGSSLDFIDGGTLARAFTGRRGY